MEIAFSRLLGTAEFVDAFLFPSVLHDLPLADNQVRNMPHSSRSNSNASASTSETFLPRSLPAISSETIGLKGEPSDGIVYLHEPSDLTPEYLKFDGGKWTVFKASEDERSVSGWRYPEKDIFRALNYGTQPLFDLIQRHNETTKKDEDYTLERACSVTLVFEFLHAFPTQAVLCGKWIQGAERSSFDQNTDTAERELYFEILGFLSQNGVGGAEYPLSFIVSDAVSFIRFVTQELEKGRKYSDTGSLENFIKRRNQEWQDIFSTHLRINILSEQKIPESLSELIDRLCSERLPATS